MIPVLTLTPDPGPLSLSRHHAKKSTFKRSYGAYPYSKVHVAGGWGGRRCQSVTHQITALSPVLYRIGFNTAVMLLKSQWPAYIKI